MSRFCARKSVDAFALPGGTSFSSSRCREVQRALFGGRCLTRWPTPHPPARARFYWKAKLSETHKRQTDKCARRHPLRPFLSLPLPRWCTSWTGVRAQGGNKCDCARWTAPASGPRRMHWHRPNGGPTASWASHSERQHTALSNTRAPTTRLDHHSELW